MSQYTISVMCQRDSNTSRIWRGTLDSTHVIPKKGIITAVSITLQNSTASARSSFAVTEQTNTFATGTIEAGIKTAKATTISNPSALKNPTTIRVIGIIDGGTSGKEHEVSYIQRIAVSITFTMSDDPGPDVDPNRKTIDIYAYNMVDNNGKVKIQSVPAGSENEIKLLSPTVKSDIGNASSMEFSVQNGTPYYDKFRQMTTYIQVDYDGETIFYGRVLTINTGFYGEQKIHCEGALAFLNDSYLEGKKDSEREERNVFTYITEILDNHNKQVNDPYKAIEVGEIPGHYNYTIAEEQRIENKSRKFGSTSWGTSKSAIEDLKSHYGGAFRIRREDGYNMLDWFDHYYRSTINSQIIEVGKNLIDITAATEVSNIFTALIPIGKSSSGDASIYLTGYRTDIHTGNYLKVPDICKSLNPSSIYTDAELNSGYHEAIDYKTAIDKYGLIFKTVEFSDAHTQEDLLDEAAEWIKDNYQGSVTTFTVKALDLRFVGQNTGKIMLGDRVRIRYPIGTNTTVSRIVEKTLTCTSVQYDLFNPENNQYTFGIPANMLSKIYGDSSTKNTNSSKYNPPPDDDDDEYTPDYAAWAEEVKSWLMNKKVWNKSTGGQTGPSGNWSDGSKIRGYFLQPIASSDENGSKWILWKPTKFTSGTPIETPSGVMWQRDSNGRPRGNYMELSGSIMSSPVSFIDRVTDYKLFEYIYDEYEVDLRGTNNDLANKMPTVTQDGNGNLSIWGNGGPNNISNPVIEISGGSGNNVLSVYSTINDRLTNIFNVAPNGEISALDKNGNPITIRGIDSRLITHDTQIFDLNTGVSELRDFQGTQVASGYVDSDGNPLMYAFGQGILDWVDPSGTAREFVVARVDGDLCYMGTGTTKINTIFATNANGIWLSPATYIYNDDGSCTSIKIDGAYSAGMSTFVGYYDKKTGELVDYSTYMALHPGTTAGPDGEQLLSFTRSGIYDDKLEKFLGGLTTGVDEDGKVVSYLQATRVIIGENPQADYAKVTDTLKAAGLLDENEKPVGLVTEKIYADQITAYDARFHTIETDYLETDKLQSEISKLAKVITSNLYVNDTLNLQSGLDRIEWSGSHSGENIKIKYADAAGVIKDVLIADGTVGAKNIWFTRMDGDTAFKIVKKNNELTFEDDKGNTFSFSKATTVSGSWSGSAPDNYTVEAKQNTVVMDSMKIGFAQGADVLMWADLNGDPYEFTTSDKKKFKQDVGIYTGSSQYPTLRYSKSFTINGKFAYNNGWAAAVGKLSVPNTSTISSFGDSMSVSYPPATVDGAALTEQYDLSVTKDYAYIKLHSNAKVFARVSNPYYANGWKDGGAIFNEGFVQPAASELTTTLKINGPDAYTSESSVSKTCWLMADYSDPNNSVVACTGSGANQVVYAKLTHGKYTEGYTADLPEGISFGSLQHVSSSSGLTEITALRWDNVWTNFSNNYGYLKFPITVHGKTKYYCFSYDTRALASGGNYVYGLGYNSGYTSGGHSAFCWAAIYDSLPSGCTVSGTVNISAGATGYIRAAYPSIQTPGTDVWASNTALKVVAGSGANASNISLQEFTSSTSKPTGVDTYTDLNTLRDLFRTERNTYIWFSATINGGSGKKWYRVATLSS